MTLALTSYERNQQFNSVLRFAHSRRYAEALRAIGQCADDLERPVELVEVGCAHAKLFDVLNAEIQIRYTGIEINDEFATVARERYAADRNFRVLHENAVVALDSVTEADVVVAFETLEHIPRDDVALILDKIAAMRPKLFLCSVPVEIGPAVLLKNFSSAVMGYSRHREYTWRETMWASLYRLEKIPPHSLGHKGFDWRWLAREIGKRFSSDVATLPFHFLPPSLGTSVFIISRPHVVRRQNVSHVGVSDANIIAPTGREARL